MELGVTEPPGIQPIFYSRGITLLAGTCAILFIIIGVIGKSHYSFYLISLLLNCENNFYLKGNLVTIVALLRNRRLKAHATTWFILSLCVSDLLFCLFNLPILASRYFHEAWVLGDALCRLFPFFFYGNVATSLMSLVAITINRLG